MNETLPISLIIASYNREIEVVQCLDSVYKLKRIPNEIIVVDDGSSDNTYELITGKYSNITVVRNEKNYGASYSRNLGAIKCQNPFLWFLDSDSIIENYDCLESMYNALINNVHYGSIGGEYIKMNDRDIYLKKTIYLNGETITKRINNEEYRSMEADYVATNNCLIKKILFCSIGGFDPAYIVLSEDCELGFKILKMGLKNVVGKQYAVYHNINVSQRKNDMLRSITNRVRFVLKNYNFIQIILLPVYEILFIFKAPHLENLRKSDPQDLKHIPRILRNLLNRGGLLKLISLLFTGALYISNLILAYMYNLLVLPLTIRAKLNKDYLKLIND